MPEKLRQIGVCETGLNWRAGGPKYVTAFGLWKPNWERARRALHLPDWTKATPAQQVAAALWHYRWVQRTYHMSPSAAWTSWGCG